MQADKSVHCNELQRVKRQKILHGRC